MARDFAKRFYHTMAWKNTRAEYITEVAGLCEKCLAVGLITPAEIVHHKIHLTPENINDVNITLDHKNLEALCRLCHAQEHDDFYQAIRDKKRECKGKSDRYVIDDDGEIVFTN